jgi:flavin reductase (DIM6/NTAB) family NADH-FMN oxidoreductase RutF
MDANDIDPRDLRRAFGRFVTGVTVVATVLPDGRKVGFTANSFASVSLDPPLVSWNHSRHSPASAQLRTARYFSINVLSEHQLEISQRMARSAADKFAGIDVEDGLGGVPCLPGAIAIFECALRSTLDAGDHIIFLADVHKYRHNDGRPLLFANGAYALRESAPSPSHASPSNVSSSHVSPSHASPRLT